MTPTDIAQLSGRDLSMAICHELYDWQWITDPSRDMSMFADPNSRPWFLANGFVMGKSGSTEQVDISCYEFHKDDALAFQVADRVGLFLQEQSAYHPRSFALRYEMDQHHWAFTRIDYTGELDEDIAIGATRAECICRTALMLVMERQSA